MPQGRKERRPRNRLRARAERDRGSNCGVLGHVLRGDFPADVLVTNERFHNWTYELDFPGIPTRLGPVYDAAGRRQRQRAAYRHGGLAGPVQWRQQVHLWLPRREGAVRHPHGGLAHTDEGCLRQWRQHARLHVPEHARPDQRLAGGRPRSATTRKYDTKKFVRGKANDEDSAFICALGRTILVEASLRCDELQPALP